MNAPIIVFWMLVGFSGASRPAPDGEEPKRPPWWKGPWPGPWTLSKLTGIIGGLLGGFLYSHFFLGEVALSGINVAATAVGAFVCSIILSEVLLVVLMLGSLRADPTPQPA
jgi:hypothetical protein